MTGTQLRAAMLESLNGWLAVLNNPPESWYGTPAETAYEIPETERLIAYVTAMKPTT